MKNKTLKILAIIIPLVLIGVMVYLFTNYQNKKAKVEALQSIPTFSVKDIDFGFFVSDDRFDFLPIINIADFLNDNPC